MPPLALLAALAATAALAGTPGARATDCGADDTPCLTATGEYHVLLPATRQPKGIVIHLHGAGGTGKGALKGGMARAAIGRGYVFVGPTGFHPGNRFERDWSVTARNTSHARDDKAFLREVVADLRSRHDVTAARVLLSGFSRGGSLVWDIACQTPDFATAYAPVAGAFWEDLPHACEAPVKLFHSHGWDDRTVPLEGRSFGNGRVVQGDLWASLFVLRATNGCSHRQPARSSHDNGIWTRHWTDCEAGRIDLELFPGGHGVSSGWARRALDWFESLDAS